jgi:hypothetical protein
LLAFDSILLVRKREAGTVEARDELVFRERGSVFVMQRSVEGGVDLSMDYEGDITETKGLASGFSGSGVKVFGRAEQPEEGEDDELDGVLLKVPEDWVIDVKHGEEFSDDGDVDMVGSRRGVVVSFHGSVENQ